MVDRARGTLLGMVLIGVLGLTGSVHAQEGSGTASPPAGEAGRPMFGAEFEFAGRGNRIPVWENQRFENYRAILDQIRLHYGGRGEIKRVEWRVPHPSGEGERTLFRAEYRDPRGRVWKLEPEYVATRGLDGYELVTPPMEDTRELRRILDRVQNSGLVREGLKSGVHVHVDGRRLIGPNGNATGLINLINMHENAEPLLRRLFNPVRGGGDMNRFAQPLYLNHGELLHELNRLPANQRTVEAVERVFNRHIATEMRVHGITELNAEAWKKLWKYNNLNLKNILNINRMLPAEIGTVEFRMNDLRNGAEHRLQVELYRRMVEVAAERAARGEVVRYERPANLRVPEGASPSHHLTPDDPRQLREKMTNLVRELGLNVNEYKALIERATQPRWLRTVSEVERRIQELPRGRVLNNGAAFTYGFELEGRGAGLVGIAQPTNAEVAARWARMSMAEKIAYYNQVVGSNHRAASTHFRVDTRVAPWLDGTMKVEASGNWEVRSRPFESIGEATDRMREIRRMTQGDGKGFHLHMRDNNPNWERLRAQGSQFADFIKRAGNWVWFNRVMTRRTDLSLKSWSNAPFTNATLDRIAEMNPQNHARHTLRVMKNVGGTNNLNIEIRGFTTDVNNIERLGKMMTEALRTGNFGPWAHTENRLHHGGGHGAAPAEIQISRHLERYMTEVAGRTMTPEVRRIAAAMQGEFLQRGGLNARALPSNLGMPLHSWEADRSLTEPQRRTMTYAREDYLRRLTQVSDGIQSGRYGFDINLASERLLVEKLGVTEAEARRLIEFRRAAGVEFKTPAELLQRYAESMVRGHGDATRLRGNITVEALMEYGTGRGNARALAALNEAMNSRRGQAAVAAGFEAANASSRQLQQQLGLTRTQADRVVAMRRGLSGATGLGGEALVQRLLSHNDPRTQLRSANFGEVTAERLVQLGLRAEDARRVVNLRERITSRLNGQIQGLDYRGIERRMRNHVKTWVAESGIERAMFRSLMPKPASEVPGSRSGAPRTPPRSEGFSNRRAAPGGAGAELLPVERAEATRVFESIRSAVAERLANQPGMNAERVRSARLEIIRGNNLVMEYDARSNTVRMSEAVYNEVRNRSSIRHPGGESLSPQARAELAERRASFRRTALGIMMGHELAHSGGVRSERVADRVGVESLRNARGVLAGEGTTARPVTRNDVREVLRVFEAPTSSSRMSNVLYRLRQLPRYGFTQARTNAIGAAVNGQADRLAQYRRADGTLNWSRLSASGALKTAAGVSHFALALFLKEMAVVVQTGDRARIEEFFDGLMTTDFFIVYGLFSSGAAGANVLYGRFLERYIKPKFVSGILRTNLVLATGMALPEIYHGTFEGKAFAINVASLGLATVAVKSGLQGISWVVNLRRADQAGRLARAAAGLRRFSKVGGWFYTAAETAVVLYFGEDLAARVNAYLDARAARNAIGDATMSLMSTAGAEGTTDEQFQEALDRFGGEHVNYRNFLYQSLQQDEEIYFSRLGRAAEKARELEERREATLERLERLEELPALRERAIRQYGSVEAYAEHLAAEDEAELDADVAMYMESYERSRAENLRRVYEENRRDEAYLDVEHLGWVASGAAVGGDGDPTNGRSDFWSRRTRNSVVDDVRDAAASISGNRLQAYDDEIRVYNALLAVTTDEGRRRMLTERISVIEQIKAADSRLVTQNVESEGAAGAIRGASEEGDGE